MRHLVWSLSLRNHGKYFLYFPSSLFNGFNRKYMDHLDAV